MIQVSDAWKNVQQRFILPESYIEIDCAVTETGVQEQVVATGTNEEIYSQISAITGQEDTSVSRKYATLEPNLWALDGTRNILPDKGPYENAGYVSNVAESGSVTLTLPSVHTVPIPGVTILWSREFGEYPPVFTVSAYKGTTLVAETTVTNNTEQRCLVDLELSNYDKVTVTVHNWSLPGHRARIEWVFLGHMLTLTKSDILSYTHEQHGDLLTGELPKYSIDFTLDNTDGRWNPSNPTGMEKYLSERQKLVVRYGLDVNGTMEWIKAGTFFLSEWSAPSNGLEARFVARDIMEFLIGSDNQAAYYDTLDGLVSSAIYELLPEDATIQVDTSLSKYSAEYVGDGTAAEIVQKCANAACCILRYDREGVLHIEPLNKTDSGFRIPLSLAYSHPEVTLSKPLKMVSVGYGADQPYELSVAASGETQTVDNSFITTQAQAKLVAAWVRDALLSRKSVNGEFRADPRLDLYDVVTVESRFGAFSPVVITDIQYSYTGSFRATYTGRVISN